jgi:hypothetical protein
MQVHILASAGHFCAARIIGRECVIDDNLLSITLQFADGGAVASIRYATSST